MTNQHLPQDDKTIDQVKAAFMHRAATQYPDGTQPPSLPQHSRSTTSRRARRGTFVAVAASVAAVGIAVAVITQTSTNPNEVTIDIATPDATTATTPAAANSLAHLKPEHDGPVKVQNYPVSCPGSRGDDSGLVSSPKEMSPIELCQQKGLMGGKNPDKVVVTSRYGWIFLENPEIVTQEMKEKNPNTKNVSLAKDALPAGITFDGADYAMVHAHPNTETLEGKCRKFADIKADAQKTTKEISKNKWVVKETNVSAHPGVNQVCHGVTMDLNTRTVLLRRSPQGDEPGAAAEGSAGGNELFTKLAAIEDSVNKQCLPADKALKVVNQAVKDSGVKGIRNPPVRHTVPAGLSCARLYSYPEGGISYLLFGE